jgi:phosphate transport system permease protein
MKRRFINRALTITTGIAAVVAVAIFLAIIGAVLVRGFSSLSWSFITQPTRGAGAEGGILYQIAGTLILIATSIVIAVPIAAGIGIVLQMYCAPRTRRWLESILHALNGVPSIVFGLVGFAFFFKLLAWRKSWLAGGLLLAVMILPTLVVAFVERLRAIPRDAVLASIGLGLGRGDVVRTLLLPRAAGGLATGTLLGLARAAGETAPIMFTAAIFSGATLPRGIADSPVLALPYHIFVLAQDSLNPQMIDNLWGTAAVLIAIVVALSALALPLRLRIAEEGRGD